MSFDCAWHPQWLNSRSRLSMRVDLLNTSKSHHAPEVHLFSISSVFLPKVGSLRRLPRRPGRKRPASFHEAFEDRALFYDCFKSGHDEIVLVGPPPLNLETGLQTGHFRAEPAGEALNASWFSSRSTMTTVLCGVPTGTDSIMLAMDGFTETIVVQPSQSEVLKDRRVMFTMNKDNDLEWIQLWARWHCERHGVDAIVIFDNGSTRYGLDDIAESLKQIEGLQVIGLVDWPFRYGPVDRAVFFHPYWPNFLQVASFTLMLRRFGRESAGILNCDIDELVGTSGERSVFDTLRESPEGYVKLKGTWMEAVGASSQDNQPANHLDYQFRRKNPLFAKCANKWALDPRRAWALDYTVFPMMHRIYGMSRAQKSATPSHSFWHFRELIRTGKKDGSVRYPLPPIRSVMSRMRRGWRKDIAL